MGSPTSGLASWGRRRMSLCTTSGAGGRTGAWTICNDFMRSRHDTNMDFFLRLRPRNLRLGANESLDKQVSLFLFNRTTFAAIQSILLEMPVPVTRRERNGRQLVSP